MPILTFFKLNYIFICLILTILFVSANVLATNYYVSPSGSDGNIGTESKPLATIQEASKRVNPGDTVIVKNGIYSNATGSSNSHTLWITRSGNSKNWITFKSENKWGAVLDGMNNTTDFGITFWEDVRYVRIEGFEIKGYKLGGISVNSKNIHHIEIYGNHIHHIGNWNSQHAGLDGIDTFAGTPEDPNDKKNSKRHKNWSEYITIDSNVIHNIGKLPTSKNFYANVDHGIYLRGHYNTVSNNIFYNNKSGYSIKVDGRGERNHYNKIINNTIIADGHNNYEFWGGIIVLSSSNWIENNIIIVPENRKGKGGAIKIASTIKDCKSNITINNNLTNADRIWAYAFSASGDPSSVCDSNILASNNKVRTNPLFVGTSIPSNNPSNYAIRSTSLAVDSGIKANAPKHDHVNNRRPIDGDGDGKRIYDIGAFEYIFDTTNVSLNPPAGLEILDINP